MNSDTESVTPQCNARIVGIGSGNGGWGPGRHPLHTVYYVTEGHGYVDGIPVKAGGGFYLAPDGVHEYHGAYDGSWKYIWASFDGEMSEELGINADEPVFTHCVDSTFASIAEKIEDRWNVYSSEAFRCGFLSVLLSFIVKGEKRICSKDKSEGYVRDAVLYMNNHYHEPVKMTDVARHLWLDEGYLYNLFRKHMGIPPKEYLNVLRINAACELLAQSDMRICEVSQSVGYADSLQFSRFFKERVGSSPSVFRKQMKNNKK